MQRGESGGIGENVVIGENKKGVAMFFIPSRDGSGRGIAVAHCRVRVRVAFEPAHARGVRRLEFRRGVASK